MRYCIKRPKANKRNKFGLYSQVDLPNGSTKNVIVKNSDLDAINRNLELKIIDTVTAEKNVKELIDKLYKKDGRLRLRDVHQPDNYKILDEYWEREYSHRDLVDPSSSYSALRRAVDAVGDLPLLSATRQEIQAKLGEFRGSKQRKLVERLSQILKFMGRTEIKLRKEKLPRHKVKYLTEPEFQTLTKRIEDEPLRTLFEVCFYSGVRIGEAFAITQPTVGGYIRVISQIDRYDIERDTKTLGERRVYVFKNGRNAIERWIKIKSQVTMSRSALSKYASRLFRRTFSSTPDKHGKFHDLRHSYAIALLAQGVPINLVANSLGNSVAVCERYYSGFQLTDQGMETIKRIVED